MVGNSIPAFLLDIVKHPISLVLLAAIVIMIVGQISSVRKLAKSNG